MNALLQKIDDLFEIIKKPFYIFLLVLLHVLYIGTYIGIIRYNVKYVDYLNIGVQLFICLFLIIRFHPFRKHDLKEFDGDIIFGSAIYLLINLGLTEYVLHYLNNAMDFTKYHNVNVHL